MNDPKHEEYENMLDWLGKKLEPDVFSINEICFSDPKQRLKEASEMGMV